jgi:hypothetical protein
MVCSRGYVETNVFFVACDTEDEGIVVTDIATSGRMAIG